MKKRNGLAGGLLGLLLFGQATVAFADPVGSSGGGTPQAGVAGLSYSGTVYTAGGTPLQGQLAVEDATGQITVVATNGNGHFEATSTTQTATIVGFDPVGDQWIGEHMPLYSGNAQNVQVLAVAAMQQVQGTLQFSGQPFPVTMISVRNVLTHAHYYANVDKTGHFQLRVPVGPYEMFAVLTKTSPIFVLQPFQVGTHGPQLLAVPLPALPASTDLSVANGVITAGDKSVSPEDLLSFANIYEHVYAQDSSDLGIAATNPIHITLYSSLTTYAKHFTDEGYTAAQAKQYANNSAAVDEGPASISVSLPAYYVTDGLNILAHELVHALVAQVSSQIPSWTNEGIAWYEGIKAELDGSPNGLLQSGLHWTEWTDIVAHQQAGTLLPLGDADPMNAAYNVEDQDYYAVQQLIQQFGFAQLMTYIRQVDQHPTAFQDTFHESFDTFSSQITADLQSVAKQTDAGFRATVMVLPGGPRNLYIMNPKGQRWLVSGLQAGGTYTFTLRADGSVDVPAPLTHHVEKVTLQGTGDWSLGATTGRDFPNQAFNLADAFGTPYLSAAVLYDKTGQIAHFYPAAGLPLGLELVNLVPVAVS